MFVVAVTVVVIGVLIVHSVNHRYAVLFTDLSAEDLTQVVNYLSSNNITDYKIENNNRILVPEGQEARLKMNILLEGYPTSGFGYNMYLSNIGSLSSDADRQLLWQADLQDRLAACITYIPGVRSAKVFITRGEDRRYILSTRQRQRVRHRRNERQQDTDRPAGQRNPRLNPRRGTGSGH